MSQLRRKGDTDSVFFFSHSCPVGVQTVHDCYINYVGITMSPMLSETERKRIGAFSVSAKSFMLTFSRILFKWDLWNWHGYINACRLSFHFHFDVGEIGQSSRLQESLKQVTEIVFSHLGILKWVYSAFAVLACNASCIFLFWSESTLRLMFLLVMQVVFSCFEVSLLCVWCSCL